MPNSKTILIVEDEWDILYVLAFFLRAEGYYVLTASNGLNAMAVMEQSTPDLILLDMRMPGMNGWEFAKELRAKGFDVPLVVMTAAADARKCAEEVGAIGWFAKPFEFRDLRACVGRYVNLPRPE